MRLYYARLFGEVEMASSKEEAMRAAGTDEIRAKSAAPNLKVMTLPPSFIHL
jgi:hypothetical protein